MDDAVETRAECVCDYLRRPISGSRDLLMETAENTVSEIVPYARIEYGGLPVNYSIFRIMLPESIFRNTTRGAQACRR
jgi:hypothetical protein